jgi:uncharacterized protein (UPF0264 family)
LTIVRPPGIRPDFARATPKLLVSVRDFDEIADALVGGADIVDLKEPRRGPLAPAAVDLWRQAASLWDAADSGPPRPPLSAALGEQEEAARLAERLPSAFAFAKAGPSRCETLSKVGNLWAETRQSLDDRIELVAVAYADWKNAQCADPELIVRAAVDAGFERCLIDTYEKDGRSTLDHLGISGLMRLAETARQGGLWWALAGSIRADHVRQLWQHDLLPDCFGVRGDVCEQGRTGRLCPERVKRWKSSLSVHSDH